MTQGTGTKTAFAVYSPPFIVDRFMFVGFTEESDAREAFKEVNDAGLVNRTRGLHLVRLDNLTDEQFDLMVADRGEDTRAPEELRDAVVNHFDEYDVTALDAYKDSNDEWNEESLSAHGTLSEDADYQITR